MARGRWLWYAQQLTSRLVARSFYFNIHSKTIREDGIECLVGSIHCVYDNGSINLASLGKYLRRVAAYAGQIFFTVKPDASVDRGTIIILKNELFDTMVDQTFFQINDVMIPISAGTSLCTIDLHLYGQGYPINGFPYRFTEADGPPRQPIPIIEATRQTKYINTQECDRPISLVSALSGCPSLSNAPSYCDTESLRSIGRIRSRNAKSVERPVSKFSVHQDSNETSELPPPLALPRLECAQGARVVGAVC